MAKSKAIGIDKKEQRRWEVESAMSTIKRYNDIMKDKSLMRDVKKAAQDQVKMLGGIVGPSKAPTKKK
jgi:hypothetical protein